MLKKTLKIEFRKVFSSKLFFLALVVGICLAGTQVIHVREYVDWVKEGSSQIHPSGFDSESLLINWLGMDNRTAIGMVFYLALPILAAMPFGSSYFTERKSGYYMQVTMRSGQKTYLCAKWIAAFVSGVIVIMIPLTLNLMANALICPLGKVHILSLTVYVGQEYFASKLFYENPILYIVMGLVLSSVWGGICAVVSLTAGMFLKNKILIIISPLIVLEFAGLVLLYLKSCTNFTYFEVRPMELMRSICLNPNPTWYVISYMLLFLALIIIVYWKRGMKSEGI